MTARPPARDLTARTVAFLHAHPDDEAIFTGATMRRLAERGARVVLVTATAGELGTPLVPLPAGRTVAEQRVAELEEACARLGVSRLVLLRHRDSGMAGAPSNQHPAAFPRHADRAVARLADLLHAEHAETLVHYDGGGIYGHPDHVAVHRLGGAAARLAGACGYQATVDRSGLPAVGRHLVEGSRPRALRRALGRSAADITTVVRADPAELQAKREAILAHRSQVRPTAVPAATFAATYGTEWYTREGRPGVLDLLEAVHAPGERRPAPDG